MTGVTGVTGTPPPVSPLADTCQLLGFDGWLTPPLRPVVPASTPAAGRARTVSVVAKDGGSLHRLQELVSADLTGSVLVIAGASAVPGAIWGEIMAKAAHRSGAVAVLVDGAVRDRAGCLAEGLPLYASDERVVGPGGRADIVATGEPVEIGGVVVTEGDIVVVDPSGVVRLVARHADRIVEAARAYDAAEAEVLAALERGEPLVPTAYGHKAAAVAALREQIQNA